MPYDGDMTVDLSGSSFEIGSITAYDSANVELTDVDSTASILTVRDLTHSGDYSIVIEGADYVSSGTFDIQISCSSDAPSQSPTEAPSPEPTGSPSLEPTASPSLEPTVSPTTNPSDGPTDSPTMVPTETPTDSPTDEPTASPSEEPSASPTTPAPSHPGELCCDSHVTGSYNGEAVNVEVRMPYDGDMTVDLSGSDFEIGSITAYDSAEVELTDVDSAASILTVRDLTHSGDYSIVIEGADYVSSGTFDIQISCSSDAPSQSPTKAPSPEPTGSPSLEPTASPSLEPTVSPTMV